MKSPRVDIFRPLAAAKSKRALGESPSSIFRRNHHRRQDQQGEQGQPAKSASAESEGFVVSVPPGQWPPHQTLSSASEGTAAHKRLEVSAPLPTGTESSDRGSPLSESRKSARSPSKKDDANKVTPPSYYKIELVRGEDDDGVVQLTAGDDSSVQIAEDHNEQLQLANSTIDSSSRREHSNIIRASPIIEHEAIESHEALEAHDAAKRKHDESQRWTISDNGKIIVVPPSPSRVPTTHFKKSRHPESPGGDDNSIPPLLVKASNSSDDSFLSCDDQGLEDVALESGGSDSLESPPRMNRSLVTPSLFQESVSSNGSGNSARNKGVSSTGSARSSSPSKNGGCGPGGCGTRFDFLGQILDVFSLNGGCCHQSGTGCA